ncbi:DNA-binding response regulator [Rhodococcoides trifolii]|uniref:DNA-binding response regulator n=1 Tax=Rhodococcoides trifolii TaxID=908250 RepID=A0A917G0Q9_9NOCA|nr:response regulator transcription factor [Rhodococcus trifolii]GGG16937.1 DNA-binding response regulator [Rhodococcus trifolii]
MDQVRIVIIDDDALVRSGLSAILGTDAGLAVVGEAADGREGLVSIAAFRPDVVLLDIRMPTMDGLAALEELRRTDTRTAVIVLTTFDSDRYILRALRCGADGFLLKDIAPRELIAAVHRVAAGEPMLSPAVTARLIDHVAAQDDTEVRSDRARTRLEALTPREREVADAVSKGRTNAEIGEQLFMSRPTVKTYVSRILAKLEMTNRVQVAILVHEALTG